MSDEQDISRRTLLAGAALVPVALAATAGGSGNGDGVASAAEAGPAAAPPNGSATLAATPACHAGDEPTQDQTEGPYFTPGSPLRASLVTAGMAGTRLVITGRVLSTACRPRAHALLDFWHADARGIYDNSGYDNSGYRLRGHQFTDAQGRFRLLTVVPGLYPGRTRHIHVKVQPRGGRVLTTQLYFPGVRRNATDAIFDAALLMGFRRTGASRQATFDFVV